MDCCKKEVLVLTARLVVLCNNRAVQVKHLIKQTVKDELAHQKWPKKSGRELEWDLNIP